MMTVLHETETGIPVLVTTKSELGSRSGGILQALASGAIVRVDDRNTEAAAALLVPPHLIPAVLRSLGIDPGTLPEPGAARDQLV
jgi:hypothetical protein